ncbi:benzoate-CoA ligase family protein [Desulfobacula sp.]|uniref:benzoate-CoA ligase family protein n=1 Tax=Desulfobacula sp. TaxID=2593537 RepID=UPI0026157ACA|nr:benzoate-CoA ligase family protein [Desulfobacula sp.]
MTFKNIEIQPWQSHFTLPDQFNMETLLLERHIDNGRGNNIAIYCGDEEITYHQLGELTNKAGNGMTKLGLKPHQRVILLLHDSPTFFSTFLGVMKVGAVPVPINVMATSEDLAYFINDSKAAFVVVEQELLNKLEPILEDCPELQKVVVKGSTAGHTSFEEMIQIASSKLSVYPTKQNDQSYWLYTSGTTGQPKGVVHLHRDLAYAVEPWGHNVVGFTPEDTVYCISRLFFSYGLNNGLYLPLYYGGSVILTEDRPLPENITKILKRYRPTLFFSVPTSYGQLLNYLEEKKIDLDLNSLRHCMSAGEALPAPLYERWLNRFGIEILDGIGSSEVGWVYIANRPGKVKKKSCGTPLPGYKVEVRDEDGNKLSNGEEGELWVSSNTLASCYWNKPDKTADTFQDGWMKTGDRIRVDKKGYVYYAGRSDDALKVGGIWVSPLEVEEALLEHTAVAECAVVPQKDEMGLIKPKAFVNLKNGYEQNEAFIAELKAFVKQRLAPYKYPRWVEIVEEIPKTSTGKIQRYMLRKRVD